MKKIFIVLIIISGCQRRDFTDIPVESVVVVEGRIEEDAFAEVLLSQSVPVSAQVDSSNFLKYIIRSAMVIVSSGETHDTLSLRVSENTIPPFIYRGNKIRGKAGGLYKLTIKYQKREITAVSTIPKTVIIDKVQYNKMHSSDTIGNVSIQFQDPPDEKNYYQILTKVNGFDEVFVPALYACLDDDKLKKPEVNMEIIRGITIFPQTNIKTHFNDGDAITVKLCTMPKEGFDFWNSWQNEIVNTKNPIFPANKNLKSNINGAVGIWCGYGKSTRNIIAK